MKSTMYILRCKIKLIYISRTMRKGFFECEVCIPTKKKGLLSDKCNESQKILNVFFYESQDNPGQHNNLFLIQLVHDPESKFILADSATSLSPSNFFEIHTAAGFAQVE